MNESSGAILNDVPADISFLFRMYALA